MAIVGQGKIVDRSRERLGTSDAGVILLRKIWSRELSLLSGGDKLTDFDTPDPQELREEELIAMGSNN